MTRALLLAVGMLAACGTAKSQLPRAGSDGGAASSAGQTAGDGGAESGAGGANERSAGGVGASFTEGGVDAASTEGGAGGSPAGEESMGGAAGHDGCGADAALGSAVLAHGLALHQLAVFQAVKVPIMELGVEVSARKTSVVSNRPALLRAYVHPAEDWAPRAIRARLTLSYPTSDLEGQVLEQIRRIEHASTDAQLSSTFNFSIPAQAMTEDLEYSVELVETEPCLPAPSATSGARFPDTSELAMNATAETTLHVQLVPVVYEAGGLRLVPDTSAEQLEQFRRSLLRLFPISKLELAVRAQPLVTTAQTMVEVLDQVAALRDVEAPPANLVYYGLVRLRETREQYCNPSCVLGASLNGELPAVGVGVGIGYSGEEAALTMAHELGHAHGRPHSPCGVSGDASFPYGNGRIGSWGYDFESKALFDPNVFSDFMGYCSPAWVSDHTFERLREFITALAAPVPAARIGSGARGPARAESYRTLLVTPGAPPSWGARRKLWGLPAGQSESVRVLAPDGREASSLARIFRQPVADTSTEILYVPDWVQDGWTSLDTERGQIALPARPGERVESE